MHEKSFKDHPIASILPIMSTTELKELAEDIRAHGMREPIVILDDMVLDGRNRYRACKIAGVEPKFEQFKGDSPISYVLSLNVQRRHLTASQMAAVAVEAEPFFTEEAEKRRRETQGRPPKTGEKITTSLPGKARDQAARAVGGVHGTYVSRAKAIKNAAPEMFDKIKTGEVTLSQAIKDIKQEQNIKELKAAQEKVTTAARRKLSNVCVIRQCSMRDLLKSGIQPDCIITDPPYPKEYLHLYGELAALSKNVPLVAVMCGQTYLPDVIAAMCKYLKYRWTLAYLTPGGQAAEQFKAKVNAYWKPVLLFGESTGWIGDVCSSNVNDNDKRFHGWGQSESGMADLVNRLSKPEQLVCDPFVGGGTTAIVSLRLGRRFVGCDIDADSCKKAIQRCEVDFVSSK